MKKVYVFLFALVILVQSTYFIYADDRLQMTAQKTVTAPVLDGIITEDEWGEPIAAYSKDSDNVHLSLNMVDEERWPSDTKLYTMWDEEYLYIGAVVTNATHKNTRRDASIWKEDSLFIRLGLAADQEAQYRFAFALGGKNTQFGYLYNLPNTALNGTGITVEILFNDDDYYVAREDDRTTYEIRFRWEDYTVEERKIEKGYQFYLNMEFNIRGKGNNTGVMMYCTHDDSLQWQYPQITLDEQTAISLPTPTPMPTIPLKPTEDNSEMATSSPAPLEPSNEYFKPSFWLYLLILIPTVLVVVTVVIIIKI